MTADFLSKRSNKLVLVALFIVGFLYFSAIPRYAVHYCSVKASGTVKGMHDKNVLTSQEGAESVITLLSTLDNYYYQKCLRTTFGLNK